MLPTQTLPDWSRAHGAPLFRTLLRHRPEDFQVTEELGWEVSNDGEHDYLFIEKIGANTQWVAKQLAQYAEVPVRDIGFAGLKDRHAITRQWFSVPRWNSPDWSQLNLEGIQIRCLERHRRKLRRGAHQGNAFAIVLRCETDVDVSHITERINQLKTVGVPNYFGEQRFGRNGGNLGLAEQWAGGKRLPRDKRGLAISTIRSFTFNTVLSERVAQSTWNQLQSGDKANLEGSGSFFDVIDIDANLADRCKAMDIHPSCVLVGDGSSFQPEHWQTALTKARVNEGQRSLRIKVTNLTIEVLTSHVVLNFSLGRGAYATAVLRELCTW
jgi:tRNA pseudouridine13 synthase